MVLQVHACLSALDAPTKVDGKYIRISAAIYKEAFELTEAHQVYATFEHMAVPELHHVALDANVKRATRADREWRIRIGGGKDAIGTDPLVD